METSVEWKMIVTYKYNIIFLLKAILSDIKNPTVIIPF